jgi:hypothetical protein
MTTVKIALSTIAAMSKTNALNAEMVLEQSNSKTKKADLVNSVI